MDIFGEAILITLIVWSIIGLIIKLFFTHP